MENPERSDSENTQGSLAISYTTKWVNNHLKLIVIQFIERILNDPTRE
jgi:hypothetical protein